MYHVGNYIWTPILPFSSIIKYGTDTEGCTVMKNHKANVHGNVNNIGRRKGEAENWAWAPPPFQLFQIYTLAHTWISILCYNSVSFLSPAWIMAVPLLVLCQGGDSLWSPFSPRRDLSLLVASQPHLSHQPNKSNDFVVCLSLSHYYERSNVLTLAALFILSRRVRTFKFHLYPITKCIYSSLFGRLF